MNGSLAANEALLRALKTGLDAHLSCDVAIFAPAPYWAQAKNLLAESPIEIGAQDVSAHDGGAYTGEISATMLQDFGVRYALVGHSERRQYHAESDEIVALKAQRALAAGVTPIVCVGETLAQRTAGQTQEVVRRQLAAVIRQNGRCITELIVAYEPVWAIGTGQSATAEQAQEVHAILRLQLQAASESVKHIRILYGGSMNPSNAQQLLAQPDIDGGLIGGAALKATDFLHIVQAANAV